MQKITKTQYNRLPVEKKMEMMRKKIKGELKIVNDDEAEDIMDFFRGFANVKH